MARARCGWILRLAPLVPVAGLAVWGGAKLSRTEPPRDSEPTAPAGIREPATGTVPYYHPVLLPRYARPDEPGVRVRFLSVRPAGSNAAGGFELSDPLEVSPGRLVVSEEAREILRFLDGRPIETIAASLVGGMDADASAAWRASLGRLVAALDENLMLDNARFGREVLRRVREFAESPELAPRAVAAIRRERIEEILSAGKPAPTRALVAPHIDLVRGSAAYAAAYGCWRARNAPARVVVLGTSHRPSAHYFALTEKSFRTPLGTAHVDRTFVRALANGYPHPLFVDEFLHRDEHSIELQVPFLQALFGEVRIVPVLCGSLQGLYGGDPMRAAEVRDFVARLAEAILAAEGETLLVAGSDLSHLGPHFGDSSDVLAGDLERAETADRELLGRVARLDATGFFESLARGGNPRRVCGGAPIYVLLQVVSRISPGSRGRVLLYRQCLDPDRSRMVAVPAVALD